ncbi:autotransporter secretion inner membrane protein TamB [Rhodovulum imhoffii]|uniref:Autotransporter secretion inner membrane protein TamB n=1 Tax=Rhodovulum imhoffii TaxID=365340 RepID=A0A2T5BVK2_9RHOB|nr:translocation/assembly module TamB domain-containing protein [Rhodovulum imhoffii]MBK5932827.1 hypothetical protein [Rhodovulum imhoffii]PTN03604.1 autotransporter secretion inner membrane protein TamB [Rhodovulum imhoffii]
MKRVLLSLALAGAALLPFAAPAQEDDGSFLERLIEKNLSGAGHDVQITGFRGALSSQATLESLTIADDAGVWLTLRGAELDWSRAALLKGDVRVKRLSAEAITLFRLPRDDAGGPELSDTQAAPFRLPELPVSVEIGALEVKSVALDESVLGKPASFAISGSMALAGGAGQASLNAARTDRETDRFTLSAGFDNESEVLSLDLSLAEARDGIVVGLIGLPGAPSIDLTVKGAGPLSDYTARIGLATEGTPRLAGGVSLKGNAPRHFRADLDGDVTALFLPELQEFFGPRTRLELAGTTAPGKTEIGNLRLETQALSVSGSLALSDGLPEKFDLRARIAAPDGTPVRLPAAGSPVRVESADITARFDAATGDAWALEGTLSGLETEALRLARGQLTGGGTIQRTERRINADLHTWLGGISPADPALAQVLDETAEASLHLDWAPGLPVQVSALEATAGNLRLSGAASLDPAMPELPARADLTVQATDISRFSALAGRNLAGSLSAQMIATAELATGTVTLGLTGTGRNLAAALPQIDPLLKGDSTLTLFAARNAAGSRVDRFAVETPQLSLNAKGQLSPEFGHLRLNGYMPDPARAFPGMRGPLTLTARGDWSGSAPITLSTLSLTGPGLDLSGQASLDPKDPEMPATARLLLRVDDLSGISALAGRPLGGGLHTQITGTAQVATGNFDIELEGTGRNLRIGQQQADRLLAGESMVSARLLRQNGVLEPSAFTVRTPVLNAAATAQGADGTLAISGRLADLALLVSDYSGPVTARGTVRPEQGAWRLGLDIDGPGGTTARASGQIGRIADLTLKGQAPLGLANPFISPYALEGVARFDLALRGPPALENLRGEVTTSGASASAPTLRTSLKNLTVRATLIDGRAEISAEAAAEAGGTLRASGPVTLARPFPADLDITARRAVIINPALYRAELDAALNLAGPLADGGRITGQIDLGPVEIQIPSGGLGGGGDIPEGIVHIGEPAATRATRARAGLLKTEDSAEPVGPGLGLDLRVDAPNRIFVRGRGLDAELGGILRIGGTTRAIAPAGRFDLLRGRVDILGQRLAMSEGWAQLEGDFDPVLNLRAETETDEMEIFIFVSGKASAPEITFGSAPPLPEDEVLAQLLFKRSLNNLSAFQAVRLAGAVAELAGRGSGVMASLRENTGLDDLDVTTDAGGQASVRAGKYISENVYTDVTVGADGKARLDLNLDVSDEVTVRARTDSTGETGIGLFYEHDY